MKTDTCNGVFAPVCNPEVCDVPRIPYKQTLTIGEGTVKNPTKCDLDARVKFHIHIYRELFDVFGKLTVIDSHGRQMISTEQLESYHAPTEEKMIAVFHYDDSSTGNSKELAVYASVSTCKQSSKFFIYSAPLVDEAICLGGSVKDGTIKIEKSLAEHEH